MSGNQQTLSTSLRQEQQLSARQLQSLELLNLPLLELEEKLLQAMESNPLLEAECDNSLPEPEPAPPGEAEDESAFDAEAAESDEWRDDLPLPAERTGSDEDAERREYLMNSLADAPTLQEQLQFELAMTDLPENIRRVASEVIAGIDDSGYLRSTVADIAMSSGEPVETVEKALKTVQGFDPPGVGCRDLAECLRLQLERKHALTPVLAEILDRHLEEIARNRLPQLARTLGIPMEELNAALAELRRLSPFPGSALAPEHSEFIAPEVEIVRHGDDYEARSCKNGAPRLFLAERYLKLLETPDLPPEDRSYLREKLQQARDLMRALELRKSTIVRIAGVIARTQRDFLEQGVEALHPLTMRQVGEELELHETTISRAVANKFVRTPQGIFPLKFFFSAGFTAEDGAELSNRAVMEKIRELIQKEPPAKPLSDEQLAQQLKALGIPVARRTVAKYREAIGIPSSSLRRRHV
ncbi:MAG: RNA polymerase factor sigma-54 [Lentisphaeria bacterium]|nr:RNA polymerase factor sigma-54 [Lentisphaeria bacterium]